MSHRESTDNLQSVLISSNTPTSGNTLVFDGTTSSWTPVQINFDQIAPGFSVSMSSVGALNYEVGQTVATPSFTATYNRSPISAVLTDNDGSAPKNVTSTPTSFNSNTIFTKSTYGAAVIFTLTANEAGGPSKTSNVTYNWLQKRYYGVSNSAGPYDAAFITGLSNSGLVSVKSGSVNVTAGSGQYIFYCYRAAYGTATFTVGGFEGGFSLVNTVSVTNAYGFSENYYVYKSDLANLGNTTVVVS